MIVISFFLPFIMLLVSVHLLDALSGHARLLPSLHRSTIIAKAYQAGVFLLAYCGLFVLSDRPWHSAFVLLATASVMLCISVIKRKILAEPLVVTDFYLVRQAIENPRLYYLDAVMKPVVQIGILGVIALLLAATLLWFSLEPPLGLRGLLLILFCMALAAGLFYRDRLGHMAHALLILPEPDNHASYGLLATLLLVSFARCHAARPSAIALHQAHQLPRLRTDAAPVVICIQLESFVDLHHRGLHYGPSLVHTASLRETSLVHGSLHVPAEGAYTMRTEAAVLTGLSPEAFGIDATDPYLVLDRFTLPTLPLRFAQAGYQTAFLHPHDSRFFRRDKVIPALGFQHFFAEQDFHDCARHGPYVCDAAVGDAVSSLAQQCKEPLFIMAVTLENHGPWQSGRLEGIDDPVEQYYHHLLHTDRMLGALHTALASLDREVLLCAWGDHVPARTLQLDIGNRLETEYFIWSNRPVTQPPANIPLYAHDLTRMILGQA